MCPSWYAYMYMNELKWIGCGVLFCFKENHGQISALTWLTYGII